MDGISPNLTRSVSMDAFADGLANDKSRQADPRPKKEPAAEGQNDRQTQRADRPSPKVTFRIDRKSERLYIQVVDQKTGEVLRQIPPDEIIRLGESMEEVLGRLLDTRA